jgi:hypothetical protein
MRWSIITVLTLAAATGAARADTWPVLRFGGGASHAHGGAELSMGFGAVYMRSRFGIGAEAEADLRGQDNTVLAFGPGFAIPNDTVTFVLSPKVVAGTLDGESARGVRGSVFIVGAGMIYVELGGEQLWTDAGSRGSLRITAGLNFGAAWKFAKDFKPGA